MFIGCQLWGTQSFYHSNITVSLLTERGKPAGNQGETRLLKASTPSYYLTTFMTRQVENRFGRFCYYYSGFVSVVKFHILNHHYLVVFASTTATKAEMVTGAVGNVLLIKQYSSVWSIFPWREITESEIEQPLKHNTNLTVDISHLCSCHWVLREQSYENFRAA